MPKINETLPAGTFFLEEKESPDPDKYSLLTEDIRFSLNRTGLVSLLSQSGNVSLESSVISGDPAFEDGTLVYTMTIPNGSVTVPLKIVKVDQMMQPLEGAGFDISFDTSGGQMTGQVSAASSPGGDALIYENNAMPPGTVTLTETSQPEGYLPLEGPGCRSDSGEGNRHHSDCGHKRDGNILSLYRKRSGHRRVDGQDPEFSGWWSSRIPAASEPGSIPFPDCCFWLLQE